MDCNDGEGIPVEVEGMSIVRSSVLGLETEAAHPVDVEGGLGGGSGGVMMVISPSAKCSMILGSFCIFLVKVKPSFNKVLMLYLCFKQNQTAKVTSFSIKAPDTTWPPRMTQGGRVRG